MPQTYLVPKMASQSHDTTSTTTQAGQAQEHDEDQANVGSERNNGANFDALHVDHHAGLLTWYPLSAELQMGQPCGFKTADKDHSPARYLKTRSVRMVLSTVDRLDSPWMRKDTLVTHILAAIVIIILSLFQIAMLMATVGVCSRESVMVRTYMRRTINSEDAARAMYEKIWKKRNGDFIRVLPLKSGSIGWRAHELEKNHDLGIMPVREATKGRKCIMQHSLDSCWLGA